MDFRILGPLEVVEDGQELAPRRAKQRVLLAILLLRANDPVTADELSEALWGERQPRTAQTALHGHVSALRKLLGAGRIETRPTGYVLRLEPNALDAQRFHDLVRDARRLDSLAEQSALLSSALRLWRGEALADFRYEDWAQADIARLEELRFRAIEDRIEADLLLGRHGELLAELEDLVGRQPLRERLRGQLMLALYREGRQTEALEVFQEGRRALAEEIGIDPGAALRSLERRILEQDPGLELSEPRGLVARQERKRVTVLVAELSGPSDPEELGRAIEPALARARAVLAGLGATVQPLFSNALIGIFGAPRAHEDDSERAVRAGAALVEGAAEDGLTARVGVAAGDALVTIEGERVEVTGEVVTAASRLQAQAASNEVALAPSVDRAEVLAEGRTVPFVGRRHELDLLERTFERVVAGDVAQLVTIVGEPGAGKTRLAEELRLLLETRESHTWLSGRCLPYGDGVTFWALGEVVKGAGGILESDDATTSARKLAELVAQDEDHAWLMRNLAPLVGISSESVSQSLAAWSRLLEILVERRPLVLMFEDMHWADPALVRFVEELVDEAAGVPLLVVCTARLDFLDRHASWAGGKRNAVTVALPPLDEEQTRSVARAVLDGGEPSSALVARAGGNPLFAQELARIEAIEETALPESLEAVISARLDTLAPDAKAIAMDAAVVGEVFWPGAVAALAGIEEPAVEEQLQWLVSADVVRRARHSAVGGQREYIFLHILVRDVAYDQIPRASRACKHIAAATWIEQLAGERAVDHAEQIAHHYLLALELDRALGEDTRELSRSLSQWLVLAAERAFQLDVSASEQFCRRALELVEDDDQRVAPLLGLALAAGEAGKVEESIEGYRDAISTLRSLGEPLRLGRALAEYGTILRRQGNTTEGREVLTEAIDRLSGEPAGPELAFAYSAIAGLENVVGRPADCLGWAEQAIDLSTRLGLQHDLIYGLQYRGYGRCSLNDLGGLDDLREAVRLGLEIGAGMPTAVAYVNLGWDLTWVEGPRRADAHYAEAIAFCEAHRLERNASVVKMQLLHVLYDLGRWDELVALADDVDRHRAEGQMWSATTALAEKAVVLLLRGEVGAAHSLVDACLVPARRMDIAQTRTPALVAAALVQLANGKIGETLGLLEELEEATRGRAPVYRALYAADIARIGAATGESKLATRLLGDLEGVTAARHVYSLLSARATLAEAEDRLDESLAAYTEAADRWHAFGNVVEEAHALFGRGRCLLRLDRTGEAATPLAAARSIFEQLDARPLLSSVDELRVSDSPPRR